MVGYNEKLHLIVEVFTKCLKSLAEDTTDKQFEVFVQQQYKIYENIFIKPKVLGNELRLTIIEEHHQLLCEKNQKLRSVQFGDFQKFCRSYIKELRIKALMQGNISEEQASNIMGNVLKELKPNKVNDVSIPSRPVQERVEIGIENFINEIESFIPNSYLHLN